MKVRNGPEKLEYDSEMKKYIEIRFIERYTDIDTSENIINVVPAMECEEEENYG